MRTHIFLLSLAVASLAHAELGDYKKVGPNTYILVLQPGAKVVTSLARFQAVTGIKTASVTGVGVTRNTTLGFYTFNADGSPGKTHAEDTVKEPREVVSLTCNLTSRIVEKGKADRPVPPHCHIALAGSNEDLAGSGKGFPVVGGHLIEAEVGVTAELFVTVFPSEVIKRPSAEFGGILMDVTAPQGGTALRSGEKR